MSELLSSGYLTYCERCSKKLGAFSLCESCYRNRQKMGELQGEINDCNAIIEADLKAEIKLRKEKSALKKMIVDLIEMK